MKVPVLARPFLLLTVALLSAPLGCSSAVEPMQFLVLPVQDLVVPAVAAAQDTVVVGFTYDDSCGERATIRVDRAPIAVRIAVVKPVPRHPLPCPDIIQWAVGQVRILPTERNGAVTVRFARPSGTDSIRVIGVAP